MSDDEDHSSTSSSDESEDINVTGLVATRARRGNAGNLYETLRAHLDDEELQKELLAEDEADDAEDYEGSDVDGDDDNDALDSSSDDDDAGPTKDGQPEDLTGEKELLKAERAENNRKRKAQAARLTVPAWHKSVKKVKLAEEVTADDGSSSPIEPAKKKRKSERGDWRPSGEDLPKRQSVRASAVANRETIQANLEENAQRARKQKATLQETAKRERANARANLTLEERLEKCRRIEKETAKQLGRFEREEAERVRLREEALMAKRRRNLDGPVIKTFTTSGYYENGKLKVKRLVHGSQSVDSIMKAQKAMDEEDAQDSISVAPPAQQSLNKGVSARSEEHAQEGIVQPEESGVSQTALSAIEGGGSITTAQDATSTHVQPTTDKTTLHSPSEIQPKEETVKSERPSLAGVPIANSPAMQADHRVRLTDEGETNTTTPMAAVMPDSKWPPGTMQFAPVAAVTSTQPIPVLREQAQRSLLVLESFDSLDNATTRRSKATTGLEPTPVAQILLPHSYPTFTDEQTTYLKKARKLKQELLVKPTCALTTWHGKYKDPKTGVVFADVAAYKMLQRMIAGGCTWNSMLECWTGPAYGQMGRPARGVPEGFDTPVKSADPGKKEIGLA